MGHSLEEAKLFCFSLMNVSGWCPLEEGAAEVAVCKLSSRPLPAAAKHAQRIPCWGYGRIAM